MKHLLAKITLWACACLLLVACTVPNKLHNFNPPAPENAFVVNRPFSETYNRILDYLAAQNWHGVSIVEAQYPHSVLIQFKLTGEASFWNDSLKTTDAPSAEVALQRFSRPSNTQYTPKKGEEMYYLGDYPYEEAKRYKPAKGIFKANGNASIRISEIDEKTSSLYVVFSHFHLPLSEHAQMDARDIWYYNNILKKQSSGVWEKRVYDYVLDNLQYKKK